MSDEQSDHDPPIQLHEADPEVDDGLVAILERLLEEAKRGEIFGLVACVERTGREYGTAVAGEFNPFSMIGHLEAAKLRVESTRIDGSLGDG